MPKINRCFLFDQQKQPIVFADAVALNCPKVEQAADIGSLFVMMLSCPLV
ncbi:hypothetical protein KZ483_05315 [Paenibacillus sp. sptzw28]|nr:hypothetical protein [Paenibacillus sp. sptzw28]QYR22403.1 hypothetical protein KZ483_05315 [Paenibacillus sp. sptzw28]